MKILNYLVIYNKTQLFLISGLFGNIDIGEVNVDDPDSINDDKEYKLMTNEAAVYVE